LIYIGSDHRGFALKEKLKIKLTEWGFEYEDMGPLEYDKDDDYPDFATAVGKAVALSLSKGNNTKGILICGSGIGVCIVANKIKGVCAGTMSSPEQTRASVNDEDTNVLCLSADFTSEEKNLEIVKTFMETKFSGLERHVRRVDKIRGLEK